MNVSPPWPRLWGFANLTQSSWHGSCDTLVLQPLVESTWQCQQQRPLPVALPSQSFRCRVLGVVCPELWWNPPEAVRPSVEHLLQKSTRQSTTENSLLETLWGCPTLCASIQHVRFVGCCYQHVVRRPVICKLICKCVQRPAARWCHALLHAFDIEELWIVLSQPMYAWQSTHVCAFQ